MIAHVLLFGLGAFTLSGCRSQVEAPPSTDPSVADSPVASMATDPAWAAEEDRFLHINVMPSDPVDAVMWRGVRCRFLGSEFGGDNSAQDRAINARMDELRCGDDLIADTRALRAARASDIVAVSRLDALLAQ